VIKAAPTAEWAGAEAIRLIFSHLPTAFHRPADLEARTNMAWASTLAGIAISHRGTTTPHAIAEPMGALFKIPHSLAVSLCTLPVLRHSLPALTDKLSYLYSILPDAETLAGTEAALAFVNRLENLIHMLNLNLAVKDIMDLPETSVELVLENVLKFKFRPLKQHPAELDTSQLRTVIDEILNGR